jgi:hypothetical protein
MLFNDMSQICSQFAATMTVLSSKLLVNKLLVILAAGSRTVDRRFFASFFSLVGRRAAATTLNLLNKSIA